jgi:hypothetical protein
MNDDPPPSGKRTDVGYKRPPAEHQFKKGHKPPPRKKNGTAKPEGAGDLLRKLLQEERRVVIGNKASYMPVSEILIRKAFELSEKGNATMRRRLIELQMRNERPGDEGPITIKRLFVGGVEMPYTWEDPAEDD